MCAFPCVPRPRVDETRLRGPGDSTRGCTPPRSAPGFTPVADASPCVLQEFSVRRSLVNHSAGIGDDLRVLEVGVEARVKGAQHTCTGNPCERQHMRIVGRANPRRAEGSLVRGYILIDRSMRPSCLFECDQKTPRSVVLAEFRCKPTPKDEHAVLLCSGQPVEEWLEVGTRMRTKDAGRDVGIHDDAHVKLPDIDALH